MPWVEPSVRSSCADVLPAKNKETQAFANEYHASLDGDDNEFAHLNNNDAMELDFARPEEQQSEDEKPETVSMAQLRQELQQGARQVSSRTLRASLCEASLTNSDSVRRWRRSIPKIHLGSISRAPTGATTIWNKNLVYGRSRTRQFLAAASWRRSPFR